MFYIAPVLQVPGKHHSRRVSNADALILFILDPIWGEKAALLAAKTLRRPGNALFLPALSKRAARSPGDVCSPSRPPLLLCADGVGRPRPLPDADTQTHGEEIKSEAAGCNRFGAASHRCQLLSDLSFHQVSHSPELNLLKSPQSPSPPELRPPPCNAKLPLIT